MKKITDEFVHNKLEILGYRFGRCLNKVKDEYEIPYAHQAADIGTSKANLTKYSKPIDDPKHTIMGVDNLIRFCEYYEVSADYLLGFASDSAPVRKHDPSDVFIKQMCEYTGLTRDALSVLHQRRKDFLFTMGLCHLLSSRYIGFLSGIIRYIQSCLYDVVAKDDRYRGLPGADKSASKEGKHHLYDVIEELPLLRDHFDSIVASHEEMRKADPL